MKLMTAHTAMKTAKLQTEAQVTAQTSESGRAIVICDFRPGFKSTQRKMITAFDMCLLPWIL